MRTTLEQTARFEVAATAEAAADALAERVEPTAGGFQLVSKLSGGGIVIRVLRAPQTERVWFGQTNEGRFRIARVPRGEALTPFQPILRGQILPDGEGARVELTLQPHPDARVLALPFAIGGALLGATSLTLLTQAPLPAACGLLFSAAFLTFPTARARAGFRVAADEALAALESELGWSRSE